jgi:hypothetical protein
MATHSQIRNSYPTGDFHWSPAEKAIARKVFERALYEEFATVITEAKQRAAKAEQPSDLWDLENYLTARRKEIDRKYNWRYSALPLVFGTLVREGRAREEELQGLSPEKLDYIRRVATL